jgi:predicted MFS family arabinose efflux permease
MQGGAAWPWVSIHTLVLVALFVAALTLYLRRERRASEPMVDLALWRSRLVASVNASSLLAGSAIIGVTSFVPMYVQGVLGRSAIVAGFALTAMSIGWPLAATLSGRFLRALDARATVRAGSALLFVGTLALAAMPRAFGAVGIGASAFLMGFGMGLLNTTFIILIQASVPWAKRGSATASNIFARIIGSTFGAAALGAVLNGSLYHAFAQTGGTAEGLETIRRMFNGASAPLADAQRASIANALSYALSHVFVTLAIVGAITMVMSWLVPQRAVFKTAGATPPP